jgi:hypothetical protein
VNNEVLNRTGLMRLCHVVQISASSRLFQQIRALDQIGTMPATPALRREEIKLEVAFANALTLTGDFVDGKEHYDRALAIYDPVEHRQLATRSGRDVRVALLSSRSSCLWILGYPEASRNDGERAVKTARETGQAICVARLKF